jgi:hypothetical protein
MANLNPSTDIDSYIQTIFDDAVFVAREASFMVPLVSQFGDTTDERKPRQRSDYNEATISVISEVDDLASQAFTPTPGNTITPSEAGGQFFLTDTRVSADPFTVRSDAAEELGMAMANKINDDLLSNIASLTGGTVGAAGTSITWGHFFATLAQLQNATKKRAPYVCVLHEYQWFVLAKSAAVAATVTNAPNFQDEIMMRWYVGTVGPVDIFTTTDLTVDASDDASGGMWQRQAIAFDGRRPIRMEPERDASRRGWELNMTSVYAHGVWRSDFGIVMTFDASTPTS